MNLFIQPLDKPQGHTVTCYFDLLSTYTLKNLFMPMFQRNVSSNTKLDLLQKFRHTYTCTKCTGHVTM